VLIIVKVSDLNDNNDRMCNEISLNDHSWSIKNDRSFVLQSASFEIQIKDNDSLSKTPP
jgi:hypothetical protein